MKNILKTPPENSALTTGPAVPESRIVITVREFAARYDASERTGFKWIQKGLPYLKISTKKTRIPITEGDRWMNEQFFRKRHY